MATRRRFSLACCEGASCLVAIRRVFVASTLQFSIIHAAPVRGLRVTGLAVVVSVVVASRSSLFLSLSFASWLSLYTLSSQIANQDNTDTTKTIANTSIRRRVATTRRRHKDSGHHSHGHAAPRPHPGTPRHPGHDGHAMARPQPRHGHDGHGHDRIRGTCPRDTTRHAKTQSHKRSNVAPCNKHPPVGGVSPRRKKQGRLVSGLKAECDFRGYLEKLGHGATGWNGAVFAVLASGGASWCGIFSCCNRCCTLHIVYNVPWIDVDGGEASLSHINVWPSTHTGSVRILDAVRSAVRPVYPGRGLYGLVPIIWGWSAILLAQPFGCRVRFPGFALGFMG